MSFAKRNRCGWFAGCLMGGWVLYSSAAWSQSAVFNVQSRTSEATSGPSGTSEVDIPETETNKRSAKKRVQERSREDSSVDLLVSGKSTNNSPAEVSAVKVNAKQVEPKQKVTAKNSSKAGEKSNLRPFEITVAHETRALEFAARHHPELAALISPLKASNPKEYARAIRELFRTSERLESVRGRDERRYELDLEAWKLNSQVRLFAARLVMSSDPELKQQLREAIQRKAEHRVRMLQFEKETLQNRLAQIDRDLEKSTNTLDQTVSSEFDRFVKQSNRVKSGLPKIKRGQETPAESTNSRSAAEPASLRKNR